MLLQAASRQLAKQSSVIDAQLFTIKQLLILREQIAPFEADFAVTEYDLDFSHMRDHLRRIMAGLFPYMPCLCADLVTFLNLFTRLSQKPARTNRLRTACVIHLQDQCAAGNNLWLSKHVWLSQHDHTDWC